MKAGTTFSWDYLWSNSNGSWATGAIGSSVPAIKTVGENACSTCERESCDAKQRQPLESRGDYAERQALAKRMCRIKRKIVVLSGKGGVGKSTVAANLAVMLAEAGQRVGLLDTDIHGPSVPKMLKLKDGCTRTDDQSISPVTFGGNLKVMSIGFMLEDADQPVIWRGPMKSGAIKQLLRDVEWGDLDYLVVDSPPGTGDEPLATCQMVGEPRSAIIVTTPQELALVDVRKSIAFCRQLDMPVLGVIENMSGFACPNCGHTTDIFKRGGAEQMAADMGVPLLGRIPIEPEMVNSGDDGTPFASSRTGSAAMTALEDIVKRINEVAGSSDTGFTGPQEAQTPPVGVSCGDDSASAILDAPTVAAPRPPERDLSTIGYCGLACGLCKQACSENCRHGGGVEDCYQRACCIGKGVDGCWECDEFPCDKGAFSQDESAGRRGICLGSVECIKHRGPEEYLRLVTHNLGIRVDYREYQGLDPDSARSLLLRN